MPFFLNLSNFPIIGTPPSTIVAFCLNFILLGLLMLLYYIMKMKERRSADKALIDAKIEEARLQELEWYREKRFLMESQAREKQSRLAVLVDSIAPENKHHLTYPASCLFFLAEAIREERQHLGTDISKLLLIDRRLRKLGRECIKQTAGGTQTEEWLSKMSLCRQMIQSNREDLRKSQNLLRNVLGEVSIIEEKARKNEIIDSGLADVISELEAAKSKLFELPEGLRTVAKSTGEQAQALFKEATRYIANEDLHAVWKEQTTLDLFSSKHRPGGRSDLLAAVEGAINALKSGSLHLDGFAAFWDLEPDLEERENEFEKRKKLVGGGEEFEIRDDSADNSIPDLIGVSPTPQEKKDEVIEIPEEEIEEITSESGKDKPENDGETAVEEKSESASAYIFQAPTGVFEFPPKPKQSSEETESDTGYRFRAKDEEDQDDAPKFSPPKKRSKDEASGEEPETLSNGDAVWAAPLDFGLDAGSKKRKKYRFNPFGKESDPAEKPGIDTSSQVIFRSDDPELWNTTSNNGEDSQSISISEVKGDVNWLGIKRIDTGEEVFSEVSLEDLQGNGEGKSAGFNGSNEYFYGARHLGFFSEECATEVETRFTYGGWGFGHLATSEGDKPEQICGWDGQRIPNGTVFEFTLYESKPERVKDDQIVL